MAPPRTARPPNSNVRDETSGLIRARTVPALATPNNPHDGATVSDMGVVWRARQVRLNRPVALKMIKA
jgi:hypothetical protein